MKPCNLGKTIIDELRICYIAEPETLRELSAIEVGGCKKYFNFTLVRVLCPHFKYGFNVFYGKDAESGIKVAMLKFRRHGEKKDCQYLYYRVENHILYKTDLMKRSLTIPDKLGCQFNNFTAIDLCRDFDKNITRKIHRLMRNKDTTVIINGKARDKTKNILEGILIYPLNLTRLNNPSICIKQAKALKDKTKGLTLCSYDKNLEIEESSEKNYIKSFYGSPKHLHRLEVHQNSQEIKDYFYKIKEPMTLSILFDQEILDDMFEYHLSSLLRFTKGRERMKWSEILQ